MANDEPPAWPAMATGTVLRDRYILGAPIGYGGTSVVYQAHDVRRAEVAGRERRSRHQAAATGVPRSAAMHRASQARISPDPVRGASGCRALPSISIAIVGTGSSPWSGSPVSRWAGACDTSAPAGLPTTECAAHRDAPVAKHSRTPTPTASRMGTSKPDNVFMTASGEVRMLDFGVAPDSVSRRCRRIAQSRTRSRRRRRVSMRVRKCCRGSRRTARRCFQHGLRDLRNAGRETSLWTARCGRGTRRRP